MYAVVKIRRVLIAAIVLTAFVVGGMVWSYSVGHRDGVISDRTQVCQSFGASDLAPCVEIAKAH